jgi:hypothetical protein
LFGSSSSTIIPLSVLGSIISKAPRASRKEKSGARMTCPIANASDVSEHSSVMLSYTSRGSEQFFGNVFPAFPDIFGVIRQSQPFDLCNSQHKLDNSTPFEGALSICSPEAITLRTDQVRRIIMALYAKPLVTHKKVVSIFDFRTLRSGIKCSNSSTRESELLIVIVNKGRGAEMSAPTDTTAELMTEHLQYAPLTLIDDVINSANAILYQAMEAFEIYLRDTLIPSIPTSITEVAQTKTFDLDAPQDPEYDVLYKELDFGMVQVETLLENAVDRNFDAFELYVLRNVFNVPDDVDGYLRLKHHQVIHLKN